MIKRLPVLYKTEKNLFEEIELKKPSGSLLAETQEAVQKNWPIAIRNFVAGCTNLIISAEQNITGKQEIKIALGKMSNKNIEYLAQEIMVDYYGGDDFVEGVYPCPRCGSKIIAEKKNEDGIEIDTRDRITDLKVNFMENESELILDVDFEEPIVVTENDEPIRNITIGFPTIEDYAEVFNTVGDNNQTRFQFAVFARAIKKANGVEVDKAWRRSKGVLLFNNSENTVNDIGQITKHLNNYGVDPRLQKICKECGKVWQPFIKTLNFFGSALL